MLLGEREGGERGEGRTVGRYLSAEDENVVRNFVSEFVGQRLVPHLEAVLKNLNEWVSPSLTCTCTCISVYFTGSQEANIHCSL